MVLGSHELTGSVEKLKQPYCVLRKKKRHKEGVDNHKNADVYYEVAGIVTRKLLFSKYPKAIM